MFTPNMVPAPGVVYQMLNNLISMIHVPLKEQPPHPEQAHGPASSGRDRVDTIGVGAREGGHGLNMPRFGDMVIIIAYWPILALYLLLFSELGFGGTVFKSLSAYSPAAAISCAVVGACMLLVFYLTDRKVQSISGLILVCLSVIGFILSGVLMYKTMPFSPILLFFVMMSLYFVAIYFLFFNRFGPKGEHISIKAYVMSVAQSLLIGGLVVVIVVIAVYAEKNSWWWIDHVKIDYHNRIRVCQDMSVSDDGSSHCQSYGRFGLGVRCPAGPRCIEDQMTSPCMVNNTHTSLYNTDVKLTCLAAFMLWSAPWYLGLVSVLLGLAMYYIARSAKERKRVPGMQNNFLSHEATMFVYFMIAMTILAYAATLLSSASMQLSKLVLAFAVTGWVLGSAMLAFAIGRRDFEKLLQEHEMVKKFRASEWWTTTFQALGILCLLPLIIFILGLAWIKNLILQARGREASMYKILSFTQYWDWGPILARVVFLGSAYFVMNVIASQFMMLFCAWLNVVLAPLVIWGTLAIVICVGVGMFLIPIVPGVPIYYLMGVITTSQMGQLGDNFAIAILVGTLAALITKILGCVVQQKGIGELFSNNVYIRSVCTLNSEMMKAIRLILLKPGLDLTSICIFVGGPDWPTSVLAGILKVPVMKNVLGTSPIIVPIFFCVLTGGSLVRAGLDRDAGVEDSIWNGLSTIFLLLSTIILTGSLFVVTGRINTFISENHDEIAKVENDKEVEKYEKEQEGIVEAQKKALKWERIQPLYRGILITSVILNIASFYVFAYIDKLGWEASQCFTVVEITTNPYEAPINGDLANFVRPAGGVGIVLQLVSWAVYWVFARKIDQDAKDNLTESGADTAPTRNQLARDSLVYTGMQTPGFQDPLMQQAAMMQHASSFQTPTMPQVSPFSPVMRANSMPVSYRWT